MLLSIKFKIYCFIKKLKKEKKNEARYYFFDWDAKLQLFTCSP